MPQCLLDLGLIRQHSADPQGFVPVPPDVAARQLSRPVEQQVLEGEQRLLNIRAALTPVETLYREERQRDGVPVRLLRGNDVIRATLRKLNETCRHEVLAAQPGVSRRPETLAAVRLELHDMLARGVRHRSLYQHTARTHGGMLDFMSDLQALGSEFRTLDRLFERMVVYDRSVALIPDQRYERSHHALLIEHPGVVGFLAGVFDHAWEWAEAIDFDNPQGRPAPLTDEKRLAVLRLMVEGYTDVAIATRLGMSTRTVANHIKKASDELGSRSRAQLAYLLARTSYLDP